MTPDERAQKAAAKLVGMGAEFSYKFHPSVPDRLEGYRAIEGQPGARMPQYSVADLLVKGDDTLPCQHVWRHWKTFHAHPRWPSWDGAPSRPIREYDKCAKCGVER